MPSLFHSGLSRSREGVSSFLYRIPFPTYGQGATSSPSYLLWGAPLLHAAVRGSRDWACWILRGRSTVEAFPQPNTIEDESLLPSYSAPLREMEDTTLRGVKWEKKRFRQSIHSGQTTRAISLIIFGIQKRATSEYLLLDAKYAIDLSSTRCRVTRVIFIT